MRNKFRFWLIGIQMLESQLTAGILPDIIRLMSIIGDVPHFLTSMLCPLLITLICWDLQDQILRSAKEMEESVS